MSALHLGDVLLLHCEGPPPDTERLLFEGTTAVSGVSGAQPVYQTTARAALEQLRRLGFTADIVNHVAAFVRTRIAPTYARGPIATKLVAHLGAADLFEGRTYNPRTGLYEGLWLDLEALVRDTATAPLAGWLQALHLWAVLESCRPDERLAISVDETPATARGANMLVANIGLATLHKLAQRLPARPAARDDSAALVELIRAVRDRAAVTFEPTARAKLERLDAAVLTASMPASGPLATPLLWALEVRLALGQADRVRDELSRFERSHGTSTGTAYLHSYAALLQGEGDPRLVAQHVAALVTNGAFPELLLLAARSWAAAGDAAAALSYAEALKTIGPTRLDVRRQAAALERDLSAGRRTAVGTVGVIGPISLSFPIFEEENETADEGNFKRTQPMSEPPAGMQSRAQTEPPQTKTRPPLPPPPEPRAPTQPPRQSTRPPMGPPLRQTKPSAQLDSEPPTMAMHSPLAPQETRSAPLRRPAMGSRPRIDTPTHTYAVEAPRKTMASAPDLHNAYVVDPTPLMATNGASTALAVTDLRRPQGPKVQQPQQQQMIVSDTPLSAFRRAVEQAIFVPESRPPPELLAPPHAQLVTGAVERAADLPLVGPAPTGVFPPDHVPQSAGEARAMFTQLAQGLAQELNPRFNVVLETNAAAIDVLQRSLAQRFGSADEPRTDDERFQLVRHGAFLSELLARVIGAVWIDIASRDLNQWAMFVPPTMRVWPFARVARFVAKGIEERDLVSFFLELEARALRAQTQ